MTAPNTPLQTLRDALEELCDIVEGFIEDADRASIKGRMDSFTTQPGRNALALTADASDQAPHRQRGLLVEALAWIENSNEPAPSLCGDSRRALGLPSATPAPIAGAESGNLWALIDAYADQRAEYQHSTARHLAKTQRENVEYAKAELAAALAAPAAPVADTGAVCPIDLAHPVGEKRRVVIASDELIDGERVLCIAIEDPVERAKPSPEVDRLDRITERRVEHAKRAEGMADRFDAFLLWAGEHLGQGYSLETFEGTFTDKVTRWAFVAYKAGIKQGQQAGAVDREAT